MSSHREAPEISKDPVADNCDVYAFVSPDDPTTVTILSNFIPLQGPAGGPNFYEFGDDVLYHIYIDNNGDGMPEIEYQFQFTSTPPERRARSSTTPGRSCRSTTRTGTPARCTGGRFDARRRSTAEPRSQRRARQPVGRARREHCRPTGRARVPERAVHARQVVANAPCPPCNIGPRSTPNYEQNLGIPPSRRADGRAGVRGPAGGAVLRRPRIDLRPRRAAAVQHGAPDPARTTNGVDATKDLNISTIAIQVPITMLTRQRQDADRRRRPGATIGVWTAASRRARRSCGTRRQHLGVGPVGPGLAARDAVDQRGDHPARREGRLEPATSRRTTPSTCRTTSIPSSRSSCPCCTRASSRTSRASAARASRPGGDPAHGDPVGHHPGVPELHGLDAGGPAAAEHGGAAVGEPEPARASSAATSPGSRTDGGCRTTSSRSSSARSRGRPTRS